MYFVKLTEIITDKIIYVNMDTVCELNKLKTREGTRLFYITSYDCDVMSTDVKELPEEIMKRC